MTAIDSGVVLLHTTIRNSHMSSLEEAKMTLIVSTRDTVSLITGKIIVADLKACVSRSAPIIERRYGIAAARVTVVTHPSRNARPIALNSHRVHRRKRAIATVAMAIDVPSLVS